MDDCGGIRYNNSQDSEGHHEGAIHYVQVEPLFLHVPTVIHVQTPILRTLLARALVTPLRLDAANDGVWGRPVHQVVAPNGVITHFIIVVRYVVAGHSHTAYFTKGMAPYGLDKEADKKRLVMHFGRYNKAL